MTYRIPPTPPQPDRRANIAAQRAAAMAAKKEEDKTTFLAVIGALFLLAVLTAAAIALDVVGAYVVQNALQAYGIKGGGVQAPFILIVVAEGVVASGVSIGGNRVVSSAIKKIKKEMDKEGDL